MRTKNITFTAKEELIEKARSQAKLERTSLNKKFQEWLLAYTNSEPIDNMNTFWDQFSDISLSGKMLTREQMNER